MSHIFLPIQVVVVMAHVKAYQKFFHKLLKSLPMDDAYFIKELCEQGLLPGDTKNKIESFPAQTDKASYFLRHVIKPALDIDETSYFDDLLSLMEKSEYRHVKKLAGTIKHALEDIPGKNIINSYTLSYVLLFKIGSLMYSLPLWTLFDTRLCTNLENTM